VLPDRLVDFNVLLGNIRRLAPGGSRTLTGRQWRKISAHPFHRPAEIHRRGARLDQHVATGLERGVRAMVTHRQRHTIGGCHADQRRAAHLHLADRMFRIAHVFKAHRDKLMRQPGLVDDLDCAVGSRPDSAVRNTVNFHK
jgi:hypothetical protein